ncbi:MAG: MerR family transcriptional regulator [Lachnospiraceae bacterium]|jgi:DNA-binding transcriptional MerR regulator|nr:MerR family transcriptional regulator [Lachnospiraceae bacterium]
MSNDHKVSSKIQYRINDVAKELGITPATLRNWEKQGFFAPKRRKNGYRTYDIADIEILRKIKEWSIDKKMGANAIKGLLATYITHPTTHTNNNGSISRNFASQKWKNSRLSMGKTLKEVADDIGISVPQLSKIENMQTNSSIDVLQKLADYYGENLLYYMPEKKFDDSHLVKKNERRSIGNTLEGVKIEDLISMGNLNTSVMFYTIEAGAKRLSSNSHPGNEIIFVVSGSITFYIGEGKKYTLKKGDCLTYKSSEPHTWINESKGEAKLLWIYERI